MHLDFSPTRGGSSEPSRAGVGSDPGVRGPDHVSRYLPELRALARTLVRDDADAEDLVQETCLRALADLARRGAPPANLGGWFRVVLRNAWLDTVRATRAQVAAGGAFPRDASDGALAAARVTRAQLRRLVTRLPPKARELVVACVLEGEPRKAVTARTGLSRDAIDAAIYRVRVLLRDAGLGAEVHLSAGAPPRRRRDAARDSPAKKDRQIE